MIKIEGKSRFYLGEKADEVWKLLEIGDFEVHNTTILKLL